MVQKSFSLPDDEDEDGLPANTNVLLESAASTSALSAGKARASSCADTIVALSGSNGADTYLSNGTCSRSACLRSGWT